MFEGHLQPQIPADLGFYDLRVPETRHLQAELAQDHGVSGFCYYYYWFNGKRLLDRPLTEISRSGSPDFPFCICWANENWTRRWDGLDSEVLIAQEHSTESDAAFFEDILPLLRDQRYIRVGGKPVLLVYRPGLLAEPLKSVSRWRELAARAGL